MNNRNKLLVGCLALLLVLSVGYALFSETITINGTATAKGNFDITATCQPGYSDEFIETYNNIMEQTLPEEGGYANDICSVNGKNVNYEVDLKYPTASRAFTVKLTNTGTITARMWYSKDGINFDTSETKQCIHDLTTDAEISCVSEKNMTYLTYEHPTFSYSDGTYATFDQMLSDFLYISDEYSYVILEPGESMYIGTGIEWPNGSEANLEDNQYFKFHLNETYTFEQYTEN